MIKSKGLGGHVDTRQERSGYVSVMTHKYLLLAYTPRPCLSAVGSSVIIVLVLGPHQMIFTTNPYEVTQITSAHISWPKKATWPYVSSKA
jgi:hypothetical protein